MIIYKITNKINGKIYIGQTVTTLNIRWSQHVHLALKKNSDLVICNAIRKYGPEAFERKILIRCSTIEELNHREEYCIKLFNCITPIGYNIDSGGKNNRMHESTKQKLSKAHTGKKRGPHTEEHKKNLSVAHKGRKYPDRIVSEETKQKISIANSGPNNYMFGKNRTEEFKQNMSEARIGWYVGEQNPFFGKNHTVESKRKMSESSKTKIPVFCVENGKIYNSIYQIYQELGITKYWVNKVLNGSASSVKGYTFKKVEKK